jgi:hypothetical protein
MGSRSSSTSLHTKPSRKVVEFKKVTMKMKFNSPSVPKTSRTRNSNRKIKKPKKLNKTKRENSEKKCPRASLTVITFTNLTLFSSACRLLSFFSKEC